MQNQSDSNMSAKSGNDLYSSVISRKQTRKWRTGDGLMENLSCQKMEAVVNSKHPRVIVDGQRRLIPICVSTGRLLSSKSTISGLDQVGIAASIYFKLLKALILMFFVCVLISSPLFWFYSSGEVSKQASSSLKMELGKWTMGNLG
jgi:hypothetical protein